MASILPPFVHRERYGKLESICTKCFQTVVGSSKIAEIVDAEEHHVCNYVPARRHDPPLLHVGLAG